MFSENVDFGLSTAMVFAFSVSITTSPVGLIKGLLYFQQDNFGGL